MAPLEPRDERRIKGLLWLFYVVILVRNAWICEDAYITFRVVDNWANGYGLRWNVAERVQVYTHPLWMLVVGAVNFVAHDVYFSGMALGLACSGATVWLLLSRALRGPAHALTGVLVLTFSKAFMDYSTGGLENPLSHLLLLLFCLEYLKPEAERSFARMIRWVGLILITRMDLVWLWLPAAVELGWAGRYWERRNWRVWLGLWPFVAWQAFSVVYYGFFFPNSAYAKLTTDLPVRALVAQGLYYLLNSLAWDPLTLFATTGLVIVGISGWRGDRRRAVLALGVLLQIAYVVRVGGDYMTGRFLTAPLLVALLILPAIELQSFAELSITLGAVLGLGFFAARPPISVRDHYVGIGQSPSRVDDERGFRHPDTSLLLRSRERNVDDLGGWVADGVRARQDHERVVVYSNVGFFGYFAGPEVHVVDPFGVGDPLMARVRFDASSGTWTAAHFRRAVPEGYPAAAIDQGDILDPALEEYWRKLELVTRGPIFDPERLGLVARFNLGLEPLPH